MGKKGKPKVYAIRWIDEKKNMVVSSWAECQKKTKGHNNMFKSFPTEEEAWNWLNSITDVDEQRHNQMVARRVELKREKKTLFHFTLDEKTAIEFQAKLKRMRMSVDDVVRDFVREYIGWDDEEEN